MSIILAKILSNDHILLRFFDRDGFLKTVYDSTFLTRHLSYYRNEERKKEAPHIFDSFENSI